MHLKQHFYVKPIHIKLLWKNNNLRCKIYNYNFEDSELYIYYNDDKILVRNVEDVQPTNQLRMARLNKKMFTLSQDLTLDDVLNKSFTFNFHILDKNKKPLNHGEQNVSFLQKVKIKFGKVEETQSHQNDYFPIKIR